MTRCLNCIHFKVCNHDRRKYEEIFGQCGEFLNEDSVVPKSEVEELQANVARLRKENVELLVSKETDIHISMEKLVRVRTEHPIVKAIKAEVARESFEEIEQWLATDGTLLIITAKKFAEIKNKYMEE